MLNRSWISLLAGGLLAGVVIFSGALHIAPSTSPSWVIPVVETSSDWVERTDLGVPKSKQRPRMRCKAALVVDNCAGEILYARKAMERRPIASLTKLLTAMVFLESGVDLNTVVEVTREDARNSGVSRLRRGEKLTLRDALHMALMASDNRAARVLARSTGLTSEQFIARMNTKVQELEMDSTHVVEPTGLSSLNISNARDCAILMNAALDNHLIRHITSSKEYAFRALDRRRRRHRFGNTNTLLHSRLDFVGGKTGYILASGWCIAGRATSPDGDDITAVVLGAPTEGSRFRALRNALKWAFTLPTPADTG